MLLEQVYFNQNCFKGLTNNYQDLKVVSGSDIKEV